eukprot:scaffold47_cov334-Pavlova_lutheri.AAC.28
MRLHGHRLRSTDLVDDAWHPDIRSFRPEARVCVQQGCGAHATLLFDDVGQPADRHHVHHGRDVGRSRFHAHRVKDVLWTCDRIGVVHRRIGGGLRCAQDGHDQQGRQEGRKDHQRCEHVGSLGDPAHLFEIFDPFLLFPLLPVFVSEPVPRHQPLQHVGFQVLGRFHACSFASSGPRAPAPAFQTANGIVVLASILLVCTDRVPAPHRRNSRRSLPLQAIEVNPRLTRRGAGGSRGERGGNPSKHPRFTKGVHEERGSRGKTRERFTFEFTNWGGDGPPPFRFPSESFFSTGGGGRPTSSSPIGKLEREPLPRPPPIPQEIQVNTRVHPISGRGSFRCFAGVKSLVFPLEPPSNAILAGC